MSRDRIDRTILPPSPTKVPHGDDAGEAGLGTCSELDDPVTRGKQRRRPGCNLSRNEIPPGIWVPGPFGFRGSPVRTSHKAVGTVDRSTHHFSQRRDEGFNLPHQPRPIKPYSTCMKANSSPTRYLGAVQYPPCSLLYVVITLKPRSASWVPSHRRVPTESRSGAARRCAHPIPWPRSDGNGRGRKASQCSARHTVRGKHGTWYIPLAGGFHQPKPPAVNFSRYKPPTPATTTSPFQSG